MENASQPAPISNSSGDVQDAILNLLRVQLMPFLSHHKSAVLQINRESGGPKIILERPWNDPSIAIRFPEESDQLVQALNGIRLPERLTAIWHRDKNDLEVIFTAHPLEGDWECLLSRSFEFCFQGSRVKCEFGPSSETLLLLAANAQPVSAGPTQYRNLLSYHFYALKTAGKLSEGDSGIRVGDPVSFWIRGVVYDEEFLVSLCRHLNFYMTYFDTQTPLILVHSPPTESISAQPQTRFRADNFPTSIRAREFNESLLHFWHASRSGGAAHRFLQCYRIVEFASVIYMDGAARADMRRILTSPDVLANTDRTTEKIFSVFQDMKLQDAQRFDNLIKDAVSPAAIWRELDRNMAFFEKETCFEGGCTVPGLAKPNWTSEDFAVNGMDKLAASLRTIRNALSHGKDVRTWAVITPTTINSEKLQPWASLMALVASDVMVYQEIL